MWSRESESGKCRDSDGITATLPAPCRHKICCSCTNQFLTSRHLRKGDRSSSIQKIYISLVLSLLLTLFIHSLVLFLVRSLAAIVILRAIALPLITILSESASIHHLVTHKTQQQKSNQRFEGVRKTHRPRSIATINIL